MRWSVHFGFKQRSYSLLKRKVWIDAKNNRDRTPGSSVQIAYMHYGLVVGVLCAEHSIGPILSVFVQFVTPVCATVCGKDLLIFILYFHVKW